MDKLKKIPARKCTLCESTRVNSHKDGLACEDCRKVVSKTGEVAIYEKQPWCYGRGFDPRRDTGDYFE